jgi:hypothetical protein
VKGTTSQNPTYAKEPTVNQPNKVFNDLLVVSFKPVNINLPIRVSEKITVVAIIAAFLGKPHYCRGFFSSIFFSADHNCPISANMKIKGKEAYSAFFTSVGENKHQCKLCDGKYAQDTKKGYPNLVTHLQKEHPDWEKIMENSIRDQNPFFHKKGNNTFNWLR